MKRIECYETTDGVVHKSEERAVRHAENRYGNLLTSIGGKLVQIDKYRAMTEFIDANLDEFVKLAELKKDTAVPE